MGPSTLDQQEREKAKTQRFGSGVAGKVIFTKDFSERRGQSSVG